MHRRDRRAPARASHRQQRPRHRLALLADLAGDAGAARGLRVKLEAHAGSGQLAHGLGEPQPPTSVTA